MTKLLKVRTDWEIMNLLQDSIMIKVAIYIYIFRCTIKIGTRYSLKLQSTRKTEFVGISLEIQCILDYPYFDYPNTRIGQKQSTVQSFFQRI